MGRAIGYGAMYVEQGAAGNVTAALCVVLNNQRPTQSVKLQFAQIYFLDNVTITI
jgi:hypothetical protein